MPNHTAKLAVPPIKVKTIKVPPIKLAKSPVKLSVYENGKLTGTLEISTWKLTWFPPGQKKGHVIRWTSFAEFVKDFCMPVNISPQDIDWKDLATKAVKKRKTRKPRKSD